MLVIKNLCKTFGKVSALNDLNMDIGKGRLYGFVGANGAGKTTTMRILTGLLLPDSGQIILDGEDRLRNAKLLNTKIGYMSDVMGIYDNLKVKEYMEFFANANGLFGKSSKDRISGLLNMLGLEKRASHYVDHLSIAMKQRLRLARCLVHSPKLLLLDELASGLDPKARYDMKEILRQLCAEGLTILVSSHILSELSNLCTDIGIIKNGHMMFSGTVEEIRCQMQNSNPLVIHVINRQEEAIRILKRDPCVRNLVIEDRNISVLFEGEIREESNLLSRLIEAGVSISSFARKEKNLEALFIQITENQEDGGKILVEESRI